MSLIDGVIQAGSSFGVQCLQFVNNITGGAGAAFNTAGDLAASAKSSGKLSSTPQLGDVAVWGNGQGGAAGEGHAGIVTGIQNGLVQVTSTNWPKSQGATQYTVGAGNNPVGMGLPSGYIDPTSIGGKNIITGGAPTSTAGMQQTGFSISPDANASYTSLSTAMSNTGFLSLGAPAAFFHWLSQGVVLRRIGFTAAGVFLVVYGLHLVVGTPSPNSLANSTPVPTPKLPKLPTSRPGAKPAVGTVNASASGGLDRTLRKVRVLPS